MASRKKKKAQPEIEGLRSRIDDVDRRLHALINERARLARQVGVSKGKEGRLID
ncbi:MAG: prephenate dehydratase, partial [Gammaproteobacteria bacterium]|nr:prephenate dehydratase [Gammaproteobacteria bacterium]